MSAIDAITAIHQNVEYKRGYNIPDWAYRDMLFMLIEYSIRSFEVLERELHSAEKQVVFNVFSRVGSRMGIKGFLKLMKSSSSMRKEQQYQNLHHSPYTDDLFSQYRKHLGAIRYRILLETQILIVPQSVRELLGLRRISLLTPMIRPYKLCRTINIDWLLKNIILPTKYKHDMNVLDIVHIQ